MQLNQLEYLLAVAKYNSFTRAAEEINISQSSLSQQVSNLEKELGINLFVRTTRFVELTPVGESFIEHVSRIMSEVKAAHQCIYEYVSIDKGNLAVGIIPIIGHYPIPNLLATFQKEFPGIKLSLIEAQCDEVLRLLQSSKIEAAVVQQYNPDSSLQYFPLCIDKMVVVTSSRHPLASRKSVHIKELQNEKFIITPQNSGHHHDFDKACKLAGFEPNVLMTCSAVKTHISLVSEGLGITVLSSRVATSYVDPGVSILSLTPTIDRKIYLVIQKNTNISPILKAFVKHTARWIESHNL
jgi:DNA-binding transcriptional LysR family regulator